MLVPTPRTWTAAEATDNIMMNNLYDSQVFLLGAPSASVFRAATTSCASNSRVQLSMTDKYYDNDNMWDPTVPTRLTINTAGRYDIGMNVAWGLNSTNGPRMVGWIGLSKNSANVWPGDASANNLGNDVKAVGAATFSQFPLCNTITTTVPLVVADYLQFWCKCVRDKTWTIPAGSNGRFGITVYAKWVGM